MSSNSNYIIGDSRKLKEIFDNYNIPKPNVIISSPPYFDILNYNNNENQIGFGQDNYEDYLNDVCDIFQNCYDLSETNSSFWLVIDTFKKNTLLKVLPFDIVNHLTKKYNKTWLLREVIIWDKEKNVPWNGRGNFRNQFEYILFFTKSNDFYFSIDEVREINDLKKWWKTYPERYNPNGKSPSNVWNFTTALRGWGNDNQEHLCPIPFPLLEKILLISSKENDVVFDPFAGSGSLLALGEKMGRVTYGIDINVAYKELFHDEIMNSCLKYWTKKQKENQNNLHYLQEFKTTNKILRFHKVTSFIVEDFSETYPDLNFKILVSSVDVKSSIFQIFIYSNESNINTFEFSDKVKDLIKQSKVAPEIVFINFNELESLIELKNLEIFKYSTSKIYSHSKIITSKQLFLVDNSLNHNVFYSIFPLKII